MVLHRSCDGREGRAQQGVLISFSLTSKGRMATCGFLFGWYYSISLTFLLHANPSLGGEGFADNLYKAYIWSLEDFFLVMMI